MLNIITRPLESINGPNKVVNNLVKGLSRISYPFVVNKAVGSTARTYIPNRPAALRRINSELSSYVLGPNLYISPRELPKNLPWDKCLYLQPSEWAARAWELCGFNRDYIRVWPTGIDTEEFPVLRKPQKTRILVYYKERSPLELDHILDAVKKLKLPYELLLYGKYSQVEFLTALSNCTCIIWHGRHESQGIALQEALATDRPILVCDVKSVFESIEPIARTFPQVWTNVSASAAPYFDDRCGRKVHDLDDIESDVADFVERIGNFRPREFVCERLSLEKQARELVSLFEKWGPCSREEYADTKGVFKPYVDPLGWRIARGLKDTAKSVLTVTGFRKK